MTDFTLPQGAHGRLKVKFKLVRHSDENPDPPRRVSWEVVTTRWVIFDFHLGWINAKSRDEAMTEARMKWPNERRLSVWRSDEV